MRSRHPNQIEARNAPSSACRGPRRRVDSGDASHQARARRPHPPRVGQDPRHRPRVVHRPADRPRRGRRRSSSRTSTPTTGRPTTSTASSRTPPASRSTGPRASRKAAAGYDITVVQPGDTVDDRAVHAASSSAARTPSSTRRSPCRQRRRARERRVLLPRRLVRGAEGRRRQAARRPARRAVAQDRRGDGLRARRRTAPGVRHARHDACRSSAADMHRARLRWATEKDGGEFLELEPGDSTRPLSAKRRMPRTRGSAASVVDESVIGADHSASRSVSSSATSSSSA